MPSEPRRAWWAAMLMLGAVVITPVLVGVLSVQLQADLGITNRQLGLSVTAFWASTAVAAFAFGRGVDRLGWRRAALIGLALCLVGQLGVAASAAPAILVGFLIVGGVAYGIVAPTSNLTLVEEVPARLRGTALGAKQSAAPVAGLVAGLAVPAVALTIGWRWAFVIVAVLAVAGAVTSWPADGQGFPPRRRGPPSAVSPEPAVRPLPLGWISLAAGLGTLPIGVLTTFSTQSLGRVGLSAGMAGIVVAVASVASLCTRVAAGWLTDRRSSDGLVPAAVMIAVGALGMVAMAIGTAPLTVVGVVVAFCGGWGWPALLLLGVLTYHPGRAGAASGRFQLGTAMGAAVGPILFAAVSDAAGFAVAWFVVAGSTALSAVFVALNARGRGAGRAAVPSAGGVLV